MKFRRRFRNARILTIASMEVFEGEVQVEGNRITYVGEEIHNLDKFFHQTIDWKEHINQ